MKILLLVHQDHPEILWNAFRLALIMQEAGEEVTLFLNGPAVRYQSLQTPFPLGEIVREFVGRGGQFFG